MTSNSVEGTSNDLRVAAPADYITSSSNLPQAGRATIIIREFQQREKDGVPVNALEITLAEIVDPQPGSPKYVRNLSFYGTTFYRDGVKVSQLGDLMSGIDATCDWSEEGMAGAITLAQKAVDRAIPVRVRFDWESSDYDGFLAAGGTSAKTPENKELRKRYTVKGMRKHRQLPNGTYYPEVEFTDPQTQEVRTLKAKLTCDVTSDKDWRK